MMWSDIGFANLKQSMYKIYDKKRFRVYNSGVAIHPFEQELKITIKNVSSKKSETIGFELRNYETQERFIINRELKPSDVIVIDGPVIKINGLNSLRDTNKQFISLVPGWNDIYASGDADVSFDFPFYYL